MFCWFCFARLLYLRLDRGWAIVHPSRKQVQPPPYFAALLVNRMVTQIQRRPSGSHLKPLPRFPDFSLIFPLGIAQATSFAIGQKNPGHFWLHCFRTAKNPKFLANFEKCLFWTQSGAVGCRILRQFCGILRQLRGGWCHRSFFVLKSPCFGLKRTKHMLILAENLA